jgi:uncharacterized membrane protein
MGYEISEIGYGRQQTPAEEIPWLSAAPVSGTIPVGASRCVSVTFDSGVPGVITPGEYYAGLLIANSSSGGDRIVPITMSVAAAGVSLSPPAAAISGKPGTAAVYTLTITNTGSISDIYTLQVDGNIWTTWLPSEVGPLAPGFAMPLTVTVEIPADAAGGESDKARVTATSQLSPGISARADLTTTALPVFGVQVGPSLIAGSGDPGVWVDYPIFITNTGNVTDAYSIATDSLWPVSVPTATIAVASGEMTVITASVSVPAGAFAGEINTARLQFTSLGDGVSNAQAALVTIANAMYGVEVSPRLVPLSGAPGEALTVTLWASNPGNITDTMAIDVISSTWVASEVSVLGPLPPGDIAGLVLTVTIPANAAAGDTDAAWTYLTSHGDGSVKASAVILTSVVVYALSLEPASAAGGIAPRESITYTLTLTNTGSVADDYTISVGDMTPDWEIALSQETLSLAPGGSDRVLVTVTAPSGARYGAEGSVMVEVVGTHGARASSILKTTVDHGLIHLPAVLNDS